MNIKTIGVIPADHWYVDYFEKDAYSREAEQSVLGAIMLDNDRFSEVNEILKSDSFYENRHQSIFRAMERVFANKYAIDAITIMDELKRTGKLSDIGGEVYLFELAKNTPSAANILTYAKIVEEKNASRIGMQKSDCNSSFKKVIAFAIVERKIRDEDEEAHFDAVPIIADCLGNTEDARQVNGFQHLYFRK